MGRSHDEQRFEQEGLTRMPDTQAQALWQKARRSKTQARRQGRGTSQCVTHERMLSMEGHTGE